MPKPLMHLIFIWLHVIRGSAWPRLSCQITSCRSTAKPLEERDFFFLSAVFAKNLTNLISRGLLLADRSDCPSLDAETTSRCNLDNTSWDGCRTRVMFKEPSRDVST